MVFRTQYQHQRNTFGQPCFYQRASHNEAGDIQYHDRFTQHSKRRTHFHNARHDNGNNYNERCQIVGYSLGNP